MILLNFVSNKKIDIMKTLIKQLFFSFVFIFGIQSSFAQHADKIIGKWESEKKDAKMEIIKNGDEYQAKLLWGTDIVNNEGKSKKDLHNPNPKLRDRDLVGIIYITNLKFDENDKEYQGGKIYNGQNGKTYDGYIWLKNESLKLRGYLGFKFLGQTTSWNRIK